MSKDLDGIESITSLNVSGNVTIGGDLTVDGAFILPSLSQDHFTASDASNQYRVNTTNFDLKSNTSTPTFRFKNISDSTAASTLVAGAVTTGTLTSTGISNSGAINTGTLTTGALNATSGSVTGALTTGSVSTGSVNSITGTFSGNVSTGALSTTSVTTGAVSGTTGTFSGAVSTGALTPTSVTTGAVSGTTGTFSGNVSTGALSPTSVTTGAVSGTTGAFSGAVSTGALTSTTGTFSGAVSTGALSTPSVTTGAVSGTTGTFSGAVSTGALSPTSVSTGSVNSATGSFSGAVSTGSLTSSTGIFLGAVSTGALTPTSVSSAGNGTFLSGTFAPNGISVGNGFWNSNLNDVFLSANTSTINLRPVPFTSARSLIMDPTGTHSFRDDTGASFTTLDPVTKQVALLGTTATTSSTTGALRVAGGIGVDSATDATSTTNGGALTVKGGGAFGGKIFVGGATASTGRVTTADTTDSTVDTTDGSFYTPGGIKADKSITANLGVRIPYGQALKSNETFTNQRILDTGFSVAGGLAGDATYLYTPGTGGNSSATYVFGANAVEVKIPQTTAATSTTTGALQVAGGVGVGGNLHVGGTITGGSVSYSSTSSGTFTVTNTPGQTFVVDSTEASTTPTTGAARIKGGLGVEGNLNVGGTITGGSVSYGSTSSGTFDVTNGTGTTLSVDSTTDATSTTTGATVITGGIGIGKTAILGGHIRAGDTATNAIRYIASKNTSTGTSAAAAFLLESNVGVATIGLNGSNRTSPNGASSMTIDNPMGDVIVQGSSGDGVRISATENIMEQNTRVSTTTASTTITTGALQVAGGSGIAGALNVGEGLMVGHTAVNGPRLFTLQNTSAGSNAYSAIVFDSDSANSGAIFLNSSTRASDGPANCMTMRNDAGPLRLLSSTGQGFYLGTSVIDSTKLYVYDTTPSTSTSTGAITTLGGIGAAGAVHAASLTTGAVTGTTGTFSGAVSTGALTPTTVTTGAISGTTGTFSGAVSTGALTPTTVTTGAITGTTGTFSGAVSTGALTPSSVATGNVNATTATFSGAVSTGALTPTTVTTGAISGTTGTFSGAVSTGALTPTSVSTGTVTGVDATFSGTLTAGTFAPSTITTGTITTTGITSSGEIAVDRGASPAAAQLRLYNGSVVTEWTIGQQSSSDNDFKVASKIGSTETDCLTVNHSSRQLKIGAGSFFGYREGAWTPEMNVINSSNGTLYLPYTISYTRQNGFWSVMGKTVTLTYHVSFSFTGVLLSPDPQYCLIQGIPVGLELTTQTEVSASCFRGTFAGITNPFYTTLWVAGGTIPGVRTFTGREMTIGAYGSGNYITAAYQVFGATGQDMWGTLTYTLP